MCFKRLKYFLRQETGVAAIESAFVFPVLMTLLFGVVDIGTAVIINTKLISATQMASDLVARQNSADDDDIDEARFAAEAAFIPYSADNMGIDIAGVMFVGEEAVPTEQWRDTFNMAANTAAVDEADGLGLEGEGVVIVTVEYTYEPRFAEFLTGEFVMREVSFVKGRDSAYVDRD